MVPGWISPLALGAEGWARGTSGFSPWRLPACSPARLLILGGRLGGNFDPERIRNGCAHSRRGRNFRKRICLGGHAGSGWHFAEVRFITTTLGRDRQHFCHDLWRCSVRRQSQPTASCGWRFHHWTSTDLRSLNGPGPFQPTQYRLRLRRLGQQLWASALSVTTYRDELLPALVIGRHVGAAAMSRAVTFRLQAGSGHETFAFACKGWRSLSGLSSGHGGFLAWPFSSGTATSHQPGQSHMNVGSINAPAGRCWDAAENPGAGWDHQGHAWAGAAQTN